MWMAALRHRNFRLLFAGRAISFFGTNVVPVALAFAVLDLGSASDLGLVLAARTLAQIAALLAGGVFGDRLPRKLVLIGSDSANCAIQLGMGLLLVSGHAEVWQLIVLQLGGGVSTAFHSPATSGLVPQTVPADALQQANAFMTLSRYGATILGAAAGGILVATVGSGWAIVLDAGTYAASVALIALMRLPATAKRAAAPHFLRELREGWGAFIEHRWIPISCGWIALYFLFTLAPVFVIGPAIAKESLGGSSAWAVILTGEAVGALLGGVAAIRWRPRRTLVVMGAILSLASLQPALLAGQAAVALIAWAAALTGFGFAFANVLWETMVQERVRPEHLSRVSAYGWFSAMCCLPLGYALAGPAAELVGMNAVLWSGAGWMALSSVVFVALPPIRAVRSGKDLAPSAAHEPAPA
jgi:MFS family permease